MYAVWSFRQNHSASTPQSLPSQCQYVHLRPSVPKTACYPNLKFINLCANHSTEGLCFRKDYLDYLASWLLVGKRAHAQTKRLLAAVELPTSRPLMCTTDSCPCGFNKFCGGLLSRTGDGTWIQMNNRDLKRINAVTGHHKTRAYLPLQHPPLCWACEHFLWEPRT